EDLPGVTAGDLAVFDRYQLGENADGNLLRGHCAYVQADRRVHSLQVFWPHPIGAQRVVGACALGAAADEPEISKIPRCERSQCFEVVRVTSSDDDDVRMRGRGGPPEPGRG